MAVMTCIRHSDVYEWVMTVKPGDKLKCVRVSYENPVPRKIITTRYIQEVFPFICLFTDGSSDRWTDLYALNVLKKGLA